MSPFTSSYQQALQQLTAPGAPFELTRVARYGATVPAFKNAAANLREYLDGGRRFSDALLVQYPGQEWRYDAFFRAVDRLTQWLLVEHKVVPGAPIAIAMRNRPEWLIAFVAIINSGAVAVPLNSWGREQELQQGLDDSEATLVICDAQRLAFVRAGGNTLPALVVEPKAGDASAQEFATIITAEPETLEPLPPLQEADPALLLFTSGTSGWPKGVRLSHSNCCQALMNLEFVGASTYLTNQESMGRHLASPIPPKTLLAVPLFHVSGLFSQFIVNLHHGRSLYIMYKWDAEEALRLVREEQITVLMGAPTMMLDLLDSPDFTPEDATNLSNVSSGGAATPQKLFDLYSNKAGAALSGGGWGMTETMGTGAAFTGYYYEQRPGASGFPSPIMEFSFRDENGEDVPPGLPGEIHVRSSAAIQAYHTGDDATAPFDDGWLATGDVGYLSDEGLLYICGRVKDMIIRGGENIYPSEIEACLLTLPGCLEAAVVGLPNDTWGEEVAAVLRLSSDTSIGVAEVQAHCRERLAAYKVPAHVTFAATPLPRNALRKLLKPAIVQQYWPEGETTGSASQP